MSNTVRRVVKPRRKLILFLSAGLASVVAGSIGCSDSLSRSTAPRDASSSTTHERASRPNPFAYVGVGHNAMVDAVLYAVSKKKSKGAGRQEVCRLTEEAAVEYARAHAKNPGEAMSQVKSQKFCDDRRTASGAGSGRARFWIADGLELSPRATELLNAIEYFVNISAYASELQARVDPINAAAQSDLDSEESQIVLSASAVAVSSLGYWSTNFEPWRTRILDGTITPAYSMASASDHGRGTSSPRPGRGKSNNVTDARMTPRFSFWAIVMDVAKADFEGAVTGGVAAKLAKAAIPEAAMWIGGSKSLIEAIHAIM